MHAVSVIIFWRIRCIEISSKMDFKFNKFVSKSALYDTQRCIDYEESISLVRRIMLGQANQACPRYYATIQNLFEEHKKAGVTDFLKENLETKKK